MINLDFLCKVIKRIGEFDSDNNTYYVEIKTNYYGVVKFTADIKASIIWYRYTTNIETGSEETGWIDTNKSLYDCLVMYLLEKIFNDNLKDTYPISFVSKDDIRWAGFDVSKISDSDVEKLADKMGDDYCDQLYWSSLKTIGDDMNFPKL